MGKITKRPGKSAGGNLKKKIRDTERYLKQSKLDASRRIEAERALASYKTQLVERDQKEKETKMYKKFKMVRFVERKKAMRKLKAAATAAQDGSEAALQTLKQCEIDIYYIIHFPLDSKYIALYPTNKDEDPAGETATGRNAFKKVIEERINKGELESGIIDGKSVVLENLQKTE